MDDDVSVKDIAKWLHDPVCRSVLADFVRGVKREAALEAMRKTAAFGEATEGELNQLYESAIRTPLPLKIM